MNPKPMLLAALCASLLGLVNAQHNPADNAHTPPDTTNAPSPYVEQLDSPVRGLSAEEVRNLLEGNGAGYARTAELNGYPGPSHVLEFREQLELTAEQIMLITTSYETMKVKARRLGREIVEAEKRFSQSFAQNSSTLQTVQAQTAELGRLYSEVRAIHLLAHLEVTPLLSAEQIAQYSVLRGYTQ